MYEYNLAVGKTYSASALQNHHRDTRHKIHFENSENILIETTHKARIIREAIETEKRSDCLNERDGSQRHSHIRNLVISRTNRICQHPNQSSFESTTGATLFIPQPNSVRSQAERPTRTHDETWAKSQRSEKHITNCGNLSEHLYTNRYTLIYIGT